MKKLLESYLQAVQEQLTEGVVENVNDEINYGQRAFYLPHKAVVCKST